MRANSESERSNTTLLDAIRNHEKFRDFAVPVDSEHFPEIHDAEFFLLDNGLVVNAEGWYHLDKKLVGEVLYAPDPKGNKQVFGQPYRKVTLFPDTFTPVPYAERGELLEAYDPTLNQININPFYAKYKQVIPKDTVIAHLPPHHVFQQIVEKTAGTDSSVAEDIRDVERLLGIDLSGFELGLTGGVVSRKL